MPAHKKKVLVTGASGFLGREVVNELQKNKIYEVSGLIGKTSKTDYFENSTPTNILRVDIADYSTLEIAKNKLKGTDCVIHTAGLAHQFGRTTKKDFWNVNVRGTENICKLASELEARQFVLISSVSVYGDHGDAEIFETFECRPESFYAESKLEAESKAQDFCQANDIHLTILRPSTIIGEGDRGNTSRVINLIDKKRFVWVGNGDNKKSLIYKNDVARGILRSIEAINSDSAEIYNLTAQPVTMKEIVFAVAENLHLKIPRIKIPEALVRDFFRLSAATRSFAYLRNLEKTVEKWLSDDIFSGKKFNDHFNFKPETSISDALAKQVDHYLKYQKQKF